MTASMSASADDSIRELVRAAREAWPEVMVPLNEFAELLVAQTSGPTARALSELPAAALWLALGCARGDAAALRAFEASTFPGARAALRHMGLDSDTIAEVLQTLRERLMVAPPGTPPRILAAAAHGNLAAQVRVAAVRLALNLHRRDRRVELDEEPLLRALAPDEDPELAALADEQRGAIKAALAEAVAGLTPRDRNVLRMSFVHGLSIDVIGRSHRVHRSTVARWLAAIRATLAQESRRLLRERHRIGEAEVESLLHRVESRIDVSFVRLLAESDEKKSPTDRDFDR